jgi:hypothetical protein
MASAEGEGAAPARIARIVALLGSEEKGEREAAYELLAAIGSSIQNSSGDELGVEVAAAAMPAVAKVLASETVGAAEFRTASYLLVSLLALELRIVGEYGRVWNGVSLSSNALTSCLDRPVEELTREDMLTVSSICATSCAIWAKGGTAACAAIDDPPTEIEFVSGYLNFPLEITTAHARGKTPDAQNLALIRRGLALLQSEPDMPNPAASGLWSMIWMAAQNRPTIGQQVFEETLPAAMRALSRGTPSQWLNVSQCATFLHLPDASPTSFSASVLLR